MFSFHHFVIPEFWHCSLSDTYTAQAQGTYKVVTSQQPPVYANVDIGGLNMMTHNDVEQIGPHQGLVLVEAGPGLVGPPSYLSGLGGRSGGLKKHAP
eukprot:scaffold5280_cov90-Skeletonema_dohrnii-CCMP3373.AAC.5